MPTLKIRLFGSPQITHGDALITIPSLKANALLYFLITSAQPHTRDKLATMFWGDTIEKQAKASLRNTLYELRRVLSSADDSGLAYILADSNTLAFNLDSDFWLDVREFEAKVKPLHTPTEGQTSPDDSLIKSLREAVALYRGDFLEGFSLKDSYEFDDWSFFERDRLQREYMRALRALSQYHDERGEYDQAIAYAARILILDNLQENVHRHLMRLYYAAGNRSAALRQYEICREIMQREMGTEPLVETTELYEQILEQELPVPEVKQQTVPAPALKVISPQRPRSLTFFTRPLPVYLKSPLVGRDREYTMLVRHLQEAAHGRGRIVVITGEVGIGKTRLVQEFIEQIGTPTLFLMGHCHETGETAPYQPIVEALRGYLPAVHWDRLDISRVWLSEVNRLVPELGDLVPDLPHSIHLDPAQERNRLFEGVTQFLVALARAPETSAPLVLFIDDLHWADEPTLQLLQYLARNTATEHILVVAACRTEEMGPALIQMERSLSRQELLWKIHLERLTSEDITMMIRQMAGMETGGVKFSRRIYQETEGNPFFVIEVIRSLFEAGVLHRDEYGWSTDLKDFATDYTEIAIPPSIREVVSARLDRLGEKSHQLLETAAATGRQFLFPEVQRALNWDEEDVLDALDHLLQTHLVKEVDVGIAGTRYQFDHDKIREVAYQNMSGARRQHLHRLVGQAVEEIYRPYLDDVVARLAHHFTHGGDRGKGFIYSVRAGDRAKAVFANEKAIEHYQRALELASDTDQLSTTYENLGDVYAMVGRHERALECFQMILASDRDDFTPTQAAEIHRKIARVHVRRAQYDLALQHLEQGKQILASSDHSLEIVRINDGMAFVYIRQGRFREAIELCEQNFETINQWVDQADTQRESAWTYNTLGSAYLHSGRYDQAIEMFERGLAIKQAIQDTHGLATVYNNLGVVHYYRGDYDRALDFYQKSFDIKKEIGDIYGLAISCTNIGLMKYHHREHEEALRHLNEAVRICEEISASWLMPEIYRVMALVHLAQENAAAAKECARKSLACAETLPNRAYLGVGHRVLGEVLVYGYGDWPAAEEHFAESISIFEALGNEHELAKSCHAYGVALSNKPDPEAARRCLAQAIEIFDRHGASGRLAAARSAYNNL